MSTRKTASKSKSKKSTAKAASKRSAKAKTKGGPKRAAAAKKGAAKKKTAKKKTVVKKKAAKKSAAKKKTAVKKKAAKKSAAKKAPASKATAKKKTAAKKKVAKKSAAKKKAATKKKTTVKKTAKKAASKKTATKKAAAKSVRGAKKAPASKASKKASTKKAAPKKAAASKKAPAKKAATKKAAKVAPSKPLRKPSKTRKGKESVRPVAPASGRARVVLTPRSSASVAPTIPIPVKEVPKEPTLEERAKAIGGRIGRQSADFRERYDESFDMSWIYHDTALEGVVYTFDELTTAFRSDEVTVVDSSVMPIYDAIRRHKEAIQHVREVADKKRGPLNLDTLKGIYVVLHPEEGDAKSIKYRRDVPQHRLYFHEYAAPDKIAYKVRQVIDWSNDPENRKNVGVLRVAAKAHYDLARTYPFTHSSGKVARLFMNLILMRAGFPPAIIHATERQRYYEALKSQTPGLLVQMLRDSVDNAVSSIEKLLDEHETNKRGFVS